MADIKTILKEAFVAIDAAADARALEAVEREYAGKKGRLSAERKLLGSLPANKRKTAGKAIQEALAAFDEALLQRVEGLSGKAKQAGKDIRRALDVSLRGVRRRKGRLHVLTQVRREADRIFHSMGFSIAVGPQVETAHYNFDVLNIPADHPARDLWDTFWLEEKRKERTPGSLLLRTHTSPVQVRYMEANHPPFRIISPGETYRYEATDASHEFQFMQIEGLMVDRKDARNPVTMQTLLSVLRQFFSEFFHTEVALRVRPSYFPFVEPGIEVDMTCVLCKGTGNISEDKSLPAGRQGCSLCSQTGWLEMLGAGMVHPNVFKAVRYNPDELQGFAFGFGVERLANLKYGIPDVRLYRSGDLKFLEQFNA